MLYKSLILCKYERLALANIDYFELRPKNKIQLILGQNGSGKSSLLSQLTPLPANHQDFKKGGYKIVELSHNNNDYILKNYFNVNGNKYHFIKNGVELYEGHSATVFRELVKQEFNVSQDVHELMTGVVTFSTMSVAERRNWFTKISDSDYTYAIQFYNKLKEQHRDTTGAIKLIQSRLVQESEKLLTPAEEEKHRYEIGLFKDMLKQALELKSPIHTSRQTLFSELEIQESTLLSLTEDIRRYRSSFVNHEGFKSIEDIDNSIINTQSEIQTLTLSQSKLYESLSKDQKTLQALKDNNSDSYEDIAKNVDVLNETLYKHKKSLEFDLFVNDSKKTHDALLSVIDVLNEVFRALPENSDKRLSRTSYMAAMERKIALEGTVNQNLKQLNDLVIKRSEMERCKDHDEVKCPNCNHSWNQWYDELKYSLIVKQISLINGDTEILSKEIDELNKVIDENRTYLENYRTYSNIVSNWSILNPLWNYIGNKELIFNNPRSLPQLLERFISDLLTWMKIEECQKKIEDSLKLMDVLSKDQEASISKLTEKLEMCEEELSQINDELRNKKTVLSRLKFYKQASVEIDLVKSKLESAVNLITSKEKQLKDITWSESINQVIQIINLELSKRESMISKIDIQKALIANLTSQIEDLVKKSEVLKLAVNELSPSQGLIAKGLTGFINHFVGLINSFIKKVWLYPMELIPVEPDEEDGIDLDYKFMVKVNDRFTIPDVSKGSAGMREVIDLAFKVVSMSFLGLDSAPLFLDEFASKFDKDHRESASKLIHNLCTNSNYTQIYMVSHYEEAYGSLQNCDITVMHDPIMSMANGKNFNENVIIR